MENELPLFHDNDNGSVTSIDVLSNETNINNSNIPNPNNNTSITAIVTATATATATTNNIKKKNKGILAFLNKTTNNYMYSPYNEEYVQMKKKNEHRIAKRKKHTLLNEITDLLLIPNNVRLTTDATEFTLLFFGASYCRHTIRFATMLSDFVHTANTAATTIIQCIYIPMDEDQSPKRIINHAGLGFFSLPSSPLENDSNNKETKNILCTICSVSVIPIVVVLQNDTGSIITDKGRYAIEHFPSKDVIESWKCGYSGIPLFWNLCAIS